MRTLRWRKSGLLLVAAVLPLLAVAASPDAGIHHVQVRLFERLNAHDGAGVAALFARGAEAPSPDLWRHISDTGAVAADAIRMAPDGRSATVRLERVVQRQSALAADCPVVARVIESSEGLVIWEERGRFELELVLLDGAWRVRTLRYETL